MKKILQLIIIYLLFANISCSQNKTTIANDAYEENNFKIEDSLFVDKTGYFCKVYINRNDNRLKMFKLYADQERTQLQTIYFTMDSLKKGPVKFYAPDGHLGYQGYFLNDKYDGKWLKYNEAGIIIEEYYYSNGTKVGVWKSFDDKGNLLKQVNH